MSAGRSMALPPQRHWEIGSYLAIPAMSGSIEAALGLRMGRKASTVVTVSLVGILKNIIRGENLQNRGAGPFETVKNVGRLGCDFYDSVSF